MKRPAWTSMAVSALALAAIGLVVAAPASSSTACSGIHNDHKHQACQDSLLPDSYSIHDMGMPDYGGGGRHFHGTTRSVAKIQGPGGTPDVSYTLRADRQRVKVAGRRQLVYTVNGRTPGPTVVAQQGDLVRVTLINRGIPEATSLHWHGIDVPVGEDGVAGVTQNAVRRGDSIVYRFRARDAGTYWYHSHQYAERQVTQGLLGAVVITPNGAPTLPPESRDVTAVVHSYRGHNSINGLTGVSTVAGTVGGRRIRLVNTNQTAIRVAASVPYSVVAIDGVDLNGPTPISSSTYIEVPAAGRVDLVLDDAATTARVGVLGGPSMLLGGGSAPALTASGPLDLLTYGTPDPATVISAPDRRFDYVIGQRTGYLDGRFGTWFSINGELIPHVPMLMTKPGDVLRVRFVNNTSISHPMHLHGQHMLVLSRDGVASTGSPWWVDTLEVHPGESYVVQVTSDNPGDWMFHCHILAHASAGLMTHLSYLNVSNPYRIGAVSRTLTNHPE